MIKYTTLSGQEYEVTEDFKALGMSALWQAYLNETNLKAKTLLEEAHRIMSAVLYGKITKEE